MSCPKKMREQAREMFVVQRMSIDEISKTFGKGGPSVYTVRDWCKKGEWNKDILSASPVQLAIDLHRGIMEVLQKAKDENKLTDPKVHDSLAKMFKNLERLDNKKVQLANILLTLEGATEYISEHVEDDSFVGHWQRLLPEIGQHLKDKHGC